LLETPKNNSSVTILLVFYILKKKRILVFYIHFLSENERLEL